MPLKCLPPIAYMCPTALLLWPIYTPPHYWIYKSKRNFFNFNYHAIAIYVPETNMPFKCSICQLVHAEVSENYVNMYASYELK